MPFGGGGALHAGAMLADIGIARALVPRYPGVTTAMGCVIADMRHDFVQTLNVPLDTLDEAALADIVRAHVAAGPRAGRRARARVARGRVELDMSYAGQTHTVAVPLPREWRAHACHRRRARRSAAFEASYRASYGRLLRRRAADLNLRSAVIGERPKFDLGRSPPSAATRRCCAAAPRGSAPGTTRPSTTGSPCPSAPDRGARHPRAARHHRADRAGAPAAVDELGNTLVEASIETSEARP